jgi:predicted phage tail protein
MEKKMREEKYLPNNGIDRDRWTCRSAFSIILVMLLGLFGPACEESSQVTGPVQEEDDQIASPAAPALVSPADEATDIPADSTLNWEAAELADSYRVQVATDDQFSETVADEEEITGTEFQFDGLDYETTYYWRVRAVNEAGESDWSEVWSFTTEDESGEPPAAPAAVSPENGAEEISIHPVLEWNETDRSDSYYVQLSTDDQFESDLIEQEGLTPATTTYEAENLSYNTIYYWRVRASNEAGDSDWSEVWSFTTERIPPPEAIIPDDGAEEMPVDTVRIEWSRVEGASTYDFQIATDSNFETLIVQLEDVTSQHYHARDLDHETTYYWRVRSKSDTDISEWVQRNFTTIVIEPLGATVFPLDFRLLFSGINKQVLIRHYSGFLKTT